MKRNAPMNNRREAAANFGTSSETTDDVYCHLVARRAVVRAALYLGVESMSQESLDTVSGVLLEYLSRIGSTLAASVEASGRTSAHCNAMDALRVVELMTPPCNPAMAPIPANPTASVTDDGIGGGNISDNFYNQNHHPESLTSWKDLAVFCFGPDWIERGKEMRRKKENGLADDADQMQFGGSLVNGFNMNGSKEKVTSSSKTGGKKLNIPPGSGVTLSIDGIGLVRPGNASNEMDGDRPSPVIAGWNAPYPDEIPAFPVCFSDRAVANPHTLFDERFHSRSETEPDNEQMNQLDDISSTNKGQQHLNATNRTTTTSISSDAIIQSIRNTISSLDEMPDDIFTEEKRYSNDFFAPTQRSPEEKHNNKSPAATATGDSISLTNPSSSVTNGASEDKNLSLNNNNSNNTKVDESSSLEPAKKKAKIAQAANATTQGNTTIASGTSIAASNNNENSHDSNMGGDETNQVDYANRPLYVPTFYPPFPLPRPPVAQTFLDFDIGSKLDASAFHSTASLRKANHVSESMASSLRDTDTARSVRSALILLGQHNESQYWGSYASDSNKGDHDVIESITNPDDDQDKKPRATSDPAAIGTSSLSVKAGLAGDVSTTQQASSTIIPLNRASGSRISRILEGSMDAPTM